METAHPIRSAWTQAVPIVLGYLPIGFAFGILAQDAGITPVNIMLMSLNVFAGSAQLIAVSLVSAGAPPLSIIFTTFVVNLRHLLMSAALAPHLRDWKPAQIAAFAFELTDETFGLHSTRFPAVGAQPAAALAINLISQAGWVAGTWLGMVSGTIISDVRPYGLDYALPAMFVALLVFQLKDRLRLLVAAAGGILSIVFLSAGLSQWNVILAALIAATLGVLLESWHKKPSH